MSLHDDLLTAAAYLEGDGVSMEVAEADRIAGVFRSYATTLCQQVEQLRNERDALRRALEVIAVGDSKNPVVDAADELVALGFWRAEAVSEMRAALCQQGERDAKRLEWIASQGDEFSSGILQDSPGDGDYYVNGMNDAYGTGKTFRDAIDAAKGKTE